MSHLVDYRSGTPPDTFSHSEGFVYSPVVSGAKTLSLAPKRYSNILTEDMIKHREVEVWGRNLPLQPFPEGMPIVAPLPLRIMSQPPYYRESFQKLIRQCQPPVYPRAKDRNRVYRKGNIIF